MKKHIVLFIIGLLLLGIGCGYFTFEILEFDYQNEVDPTISMEHQTKTYEVGPTRQYEIDVDDGKIKILFDNAMQNTMEITTKYPKDLIRLHYEEEKEHHYKKELSYHFYDTTKISNVRKTIEGIIENIAEKRFYNYEKTFVPVVEIKIKEENLKYIELDEDKIWHHQ